MSIIFLSIEILKLQKCKVLKQDEAATQHCIIFRLLVMNLIFLSDRIEFRNRHKFLVYCWNLF